MYVHIKEKNHYNHFIDGTIKQSSLRKFQNAAATKHRTICYVISQRHLLTTHVGRKFCWKGHR